MSLVRHVRIIKMLIENLEKALNWQHVQQLSFIPHQLLNHDNLSSSDLLKPKCQNEHDFKV